MIVADTNLIAYLLIPGDRSALARSVLAKAPSWAVPTFWRSEFRNVLALYVRQRHFSLDEALSLMREAEDLLRDQEQSVDSEAVLRLAGQSGCSAYDAEFVHVAQKLGVPLVTSDQKLLRAFPQVTVSLEGFTA